MVSTGDGDGPRLAAGYCGLAGFFLLELVLPAPGGASALSASENDQGTTRLIIAAYAVATDLPLLARRRRFARLPRRFAAAGLRVQGAGLAGAYARRIAAEEQLLRRELSGYARYAEATSRLIPFVW